jgi:hypothetical protein
LALTSSPETPGLAMTSRRPAPAARAADLRGIPAPASAPDGAPTDDRRRRVAEALELFDAAYGIGEDVAAFHAAADWRDVALVVLSEAVAALALESRAGKGRLRR